MERIKIVSRTQYEKRKITINAIVVESIFVGNLPGPTTIDNLSNRRKIELADNSIVSQKSVSIFAVNSQNQCSFALMT